MQDHQKPVIVSVGVDYLTLTSREEDSRIELYDIGCDYLEHEYRLGNLRKPMSPHGYEGTKCGAVFVGNRQGQIMLRISGPRADDVMELLRGIDVNCTRIDLQVTLKLPQYDGQYGHRKQQEALQFRHSHRLKNKGHISHILGNGNGDTTYIGSRTSPRFGRIYDKHMESGAEMWENCWRWELELKDYVGQKAFDTVCAADGDTSTVLSIVYAQFRDWGFNLSPVGKEDLYLNGAGRADSDAERKLGWIAKQVFSSMVDVFRAGKGDQLQMVFERAKRESIDSESETRYIAVE